MPECKNCEFFQDVGEGPRNKRCRNKTYKAKGAGRLTASAARSDEDLCGADGRGYVGPADEPKKKRTRKK